jgi:hypothetical protein
MKNYFTEMFTDAPANAIIPTFAIFAAFRSQRSSGTEYELSSLTLDNGNTQFPKYCI